MYSMKLRAFKMDLLNKHRMLIYTTLTRNLIEQQKITYEANSLASLLHKIKITRMSVIK